MTNYDKGTQDEPVSDTPAVDRPTRGKVALEAVFTGLMAGVLVWLVLGELENPSTWGRLGVLAYALLTGFYLWGLVKLLRRRWAKAPVVSTPPVAYLNRDGERWRVLTDGTLALNQVTTSKGFTLEEVNQDWGPLTPVQD